MCDRSVDGSGQLIGRDHARQQVKQEGVLSAVMIEGDALHPVQVVNAIDPPCEYLRRQRAKTPAQRND